MTHEVQYVRLGDVVEILDEVNSANHQYPVLGMNKDKCFMPTVANLDYDNLGKYKVVQNQCFAFSGMQTGRDKCIRIARYTDEQPALISPAYTTFRLRCADSGIRILPTYFFMFFVREEADRYGAFISDSSVRANLDWSRFCDIKIPLPEMEIQRQVVDVWEGLHAMKQDNEAQAEPLMNLCMCYLEKLRKEYPHAPIGRLIREIDERNSSAVELPVLGLNREKVFIPTAANMDGVDLTRYKIIRGGDFAFSGMQTGRDKCIRLSLYDKQTPALISPAYTTFVIDDSDVLPEYFYLQFLRNEMDRYGAFISDSSVRANLEWSRFQDIRIPIPPIEKQRAIVDIYRCARESREIAAAAGELCRRVTPALVRKAEHARERRSG